MAVSRKHSGSALTRLTGELDSYRDALTDPEQNGRGTLFRMQERLPVLFSMAKGYPQKDGIQQKALELIRELSRDVAIAAAVEAASQAKAGEHLLAGMLYEAALGIGYYARGLPGMKPQLQAWGKSKVREMGKSGDHEFETGSYTIKTDGSGYGFPDIVEIARRGGLARAVIETEDRPLHSGIMALFTIRHLRADGTCRGTRPETIRDFVLGQYALYLHGIVSSAMQNSAARVKKGGRGVMTLLEATSVLCQESSFVEPGREYSMAFGLASMFAGDMSTAAPILITQVEAGIRNEVLLRSGRSPVSTTDDETGCERRYILNELLDPQAPWLCECVEKKTLSLLRMVLIAEDEGGMNVRNEVAHGFLDDDELKGQSRVWLACYLALALVTQGTCPDFRNRPIML